MACLRSLHPSIEMQTLCPVAGGGCPSIQAHQQEPSQMKLMHLHWQRAPRGAPSLQCSVFKACLGMQTSPQTLEPLRGSSLSSVPQENQVTGEVSQTGPVWQAVLYE